jgi:hypothetical protein
MGTEINQDIRQLQELGIQNDFKCSYPRIDQKKEYW